MNLEENESCIQFLCVPQVDDASPDYGTGDDRRVTRCKDPFCPKGYDIKLQPVKSPKDCPQYEILKFARIIFKLLNLFADSPARQQLKKMQFATLQVEPSPLLMELSINTRFVIICWLVILLMKNGTSSLRKIAQEEIIFAPSK